MQIETVLRFHLTPQVAGFKKTNNNKRWRGCRQGGALTTLGGNVKWAATVAIREQVPQKTENLSSIPPGYMSDPIQVSAPQRNTHIRVHCSTIHNSQ